ncbi:MAG: 1-acyl-sn-glycerol-3-phosphate acyltransferase [Clostridia bacterium]|nr:1-acyl-sn-glycerol-3-phosphate acyltransferase [Clostridia bacterium]
MKSRAYAFWHFVLAWFVRIVFFIVRRGSRNEPFPEDGPYIIASNHISALDPVIVCAVTRRQQPRWMAKSELFRVPVIGGIIRAWGAYPVERSGKDAGVVMKTVSMLGDGMCVGIFPQGTRRPGTDPSGTPLRPGLGFICAHSRATVLPVRISAPGMRVRPFLPVFVTVGKPITYDEYTKGGTETGSSEITRFVFDRICSLDSRGLRGLPPKNDEDNQS